MAANGTLLCIHRNPAQLSLLEENGYELVTATNGHDGLRLFLSRTVDAIVIEHHLGVLNGSFMAAEIKQVRPKVPIVMLGEHAELPDGAFKFVDALVSTSDPPHFLWAAVHFVLNVKPARRHTGRLRTEVQVHSRRPARSRREFGRRRGNTSVTDQSVNEEEDAPFPQVYGEASGMGPSNFDHNPKRSGSRSRADRLLD